MIAVMLLMFVAGVALTVAASNPGQVTLRWLRLGGIVAICLLAVAGTILIMAESLIRPTWSGLGVTAALLVGQVIAVQLARTRLQRALALLAFLAAWATAAWAIAEFRAGLPDAPELALPTLLAQVTPTVGLSAGILGGFLMSMLLGHAYLTAAGEMTQAPFQRLVLMLAVLLLLRALLSVVLALLPWWGSEEVNYIARTWTSVMIVARYAVGLVVPAVFLYMTYDCVRRRSNQSATGILYVAGVLVIVGEGVSLVLLRSTGLLF